MRRHRVATVCKDKKWRLFDIEFVQAHHITSHHSTSHHITSHHITSHHITSHHITSHHITQLVESILRYASTGSPGRSSDLFGTKGATGILKKVFGNVKVSAHNFIDVTRLPLNVID